MNKIVGFIVLVGLLAQLDGIVLLGIIVGVIIFGILFALGCKGFSIGIGRSRFYF